MPLTYQKIRVEFHLQIIGKAKSIFSKSYIWKPSHF